MTRVLQETRPQIAAPATHPLASLGIAVVLAAIFIQACVIVQARPQDLVTGVHGMVDIIGRSVPPDLTQFVPSLMPALETVDLAIFGTVFGVILAFPLAVLAAHNVTPSRSLYFVARTLIGICRVVPDLVWALLFVTAVGLGPFPGALALAVHSVGMLGRLSPR